MHTNWYALFMGTRKHIVTKALGLFICKSYKAATIADLEVATGMTKGAFYHYFKSKEELFIEVIDNYYLTCLILSIEGSSHGTPLKVAIERQIDQIRLRIEEIKEITNKEVLDPHLFLLFIEAKAYYPNFMEKVRDREVKYQNNWEDIIKSAKEKNEINSNIDTTILAINIAALAGSIFKSILKEQSVDRSLFLLKMQYEQIYSLIKL